MKRYLKRIANRDDMVFAHTISIPAELVRELDQSDSIAELKIRDGSIMINWYNPRV